MTRLCLLLMLALAPAALAKGPKLSPLAEAEKEMADGEFERALKKLDAALKKTTDPTEVAKLQLARGQSLLALGKAEPARAAFVAAMKKDPTLELDRSRASPDALRLFEKARAEIPSTLSVKVKNGEATLAVDDKDMGPAPLKMQVSAGTHRVMATSSDGRSATSEVAVLAGRKADVELELVAPAKPAEPVKEEPVVKKNDPPPSNPPPGSGRGTTTTVTAQPAGRSKLGLVPLVAGVLIAGGGGLFIALASGQYGRLTNPQGPSLTSAEESSAVSTGRMFQTVGWVLAGVGVAAMAVGGIMLAIAPSSPEPNLGLLVTPDGAVVALSGHF